MGVRPAAALTAYAIKQLKDRSPSGAALAAAGTALIYRGATGHCHLDAAAGINTAADEDDTKRALAGPRGVNVEDSVTINASPEELYVFWRNFELLPRFMAHLVEVRQIDVRRSHWVAKAPAGRTVEWDAEIINEVPGDLIGWRTLPASDVVSAGSVHFKAAPGAAAARSVRLQRSTRRKVGATIAWMLGHDRARHSRGPAPLQATHGNRRGSHHQRPATGAKMKALVWNGTNDVRVERVPDPTILNGRDALIKVTTTAICGSDLHLLNGYIPTMQAGDILGHEFMGEVIEVGKENTRLRVGDRVVVPFTIACGRCFFCERKLWSCCDNSNPNAWMAEELYGYTTSGLFGYSHLTGGYAGGQAQYVRVPFADVGPLKVPDSLTDEQVRSVRIFQTSFMAAENYGSSGDGAVGCG
jgi:uncharacterized membrane protein